MRASLTLILIAVTCGAACAQNFDAVSVKPVPPGSRRPRVAMTGGPGSNDPGRISYENVSLGSMISAAYDLKDYQLSGPEWITGYPSERYDVVATMPRGTTREEFRLMQQHLLAERFKLRFHKETRELPMYMLVLAKGGPKLKRAVPAPQPDADALAEEANKPSAPMKKDADGYPILSAGMTMAVMNDRARMQNQGRIELLVNFLAGQSRQPVADATGLKDEYVFSLSWAPRPAAPGADDQGPDLFEALREQLGLKLESKKGPVEMLVIDHAEKVPTEN